MFYIDALTFHLMSCFHSGCWCLPDFIFISPLSLLGFPAWLYSGWQLAKSASLLMNGNRTYLWHTEGHPSSSYFSFILKSHLLSFVTFYFRCYLNLCSVWLCKTASCRLGYVCPILKRQGFTNRNQVTGELVNGKMLQLQKQEKLSALSYHTQWWF